MNPKAPLRGKQTDIDDTGRAVRKRHNRIAPIYDLAEYPVERLAFQRWRRIIWSIVEGKNVLEVGVGTGKNMAHYPPGAHVTAVDVSPKMLERARRAPVASRVNVELRLMDVEQLEFPDDTFDAAVATFVFCSVPIPIRGLTELSRVVKPGGRIYLLEHVRVDKPLLGRLMDFWNPVAVRVSGANINRRTVSDVRRACLHVEEVRNLAPLGLVKLIVARSNKNSSDETATAGAGCGED